ncbi:hypothetical protein FS837_002704 [Tulasnella sp. UAMH 9824]|nr:hypothetical protein FS837_002704 [Tulasnella sp. UAMH 9824]
MSTDLERGPALQLFVSWLARQSPHQTAYYDIVMERRSLVISNSREEHGTNPYRRARFFGSTASFDRNGIQVLEEIDKLGAESTPLKLTIKNPYCVGVLVDYLKQPKIDEEGTHRWPLSTLSSVRFNHQMSKPILNIICDFARVRKDVARVTIEPPDLQEVAEDWKRWDASISSPLQEVQKRCPKFAEFAGWLRTLITHATMIQTTLEASEYLGPLPLELFICVLSFSLSGLGPIKALARLEQLRLVSKVWHVTIDSTPQFWMTIPNDPKTAPKITDWIKKSGDAPLHIISDGLNDPLEPFMSLLNLHVHRWKTVKIWSDDWDASRYLDRPTPLLEELSLAGPSFGPDASLCSGVTPSLSDVKLLRVNLPRDLGFLKHLKELHLYRVTYLTDKLSIGQIYDILSACPNLIRLLLNIEHKEDAHRRTPITFPRLEDLTVASTPRLDGWAAHLLSLIDAPNLLNISTRLDSGPSTPALLLTKSWLTRLSLHQTTQYMVTIWQWGLTCSMVREQGCANSSQHCRLSLSWRRPTSNEKAGVQILEVMDNFGSQYPPLALTIKDPRFAPTCIEYLKQPKVDKDGTQRWTLPTLYSVRFILGNGPSWDCMSAFALVRTDIAKITTQRPDSYGQVYDSRKWDAESMSFIPLMPE